MKAKRTASADVTITNNHEDQEETGKLKEQKPETSSLEGLYTSVLIDNLDENLSEQLGKIAGGWLSWQCQMIVGLYYGAVYLGPGKSYNPISVWPDKTNNSDFCAIISKVRESKSSQWLLKQNNPDGNRTQDILATPVIDQDEILFIIVIVITSRPAAQRKAIAQLLDWGSLWLKNNVQDNLIGKESNNNEREQLLSSIIETEDAKESAQLFIDTLEEKFGCYRVSIGHVEESNLKIHAISHTSEFDQSSSYIADLKSVMLESLDQKTVITYPNNLNPDENSVNTYLHESWSNTNDQAAICTLPLVTNINGQRTCTGILTLERKEGSNFKTSDLQLLTQYTSIIAPIIHERIETQKPAWDIFRKRIKNKVSSSKRFSKSRYILITILFGLIATGLIHIDYQVKAPAILEASSKKVIVAPFEGYLLQSTYRAGDTVKEGQVLASFDDSNLLIELEKSQSEIDKHQQEYQEALASYKKSEVAIYRAILDQLRAERALIEQNIELSTVKAPFDGIIVSGDLTQAIGSPISTGELLFEIAPQGQYKLRIEIGEFDIGNIEPGANGKLRLTSIPYQKFHLELDEVLPISVAEGGRNFFPTSARLLESSVKFRPGMSGIAKIDAGRRPLLWIWTHKLIDRVRIWLWATTW